MSQRERGEERQKVKDIINVSELFAAVVVTLSSAELCYLLNDRK